MVRDDVPAGQTREPRFRTPVANARPADFFVAPVSLGLSYPLVRTIHAARGPGVCYQRTRKYCREPAYAPGARTGAGSAGRPRGEPVTWLRLDVPETPPGGTGRAAAPPAPRARPGWRRDRPGGARCPRQGAGARRSRGGRALRGHRGPAAVPRAGPRDEADAAVGVGVGVDRRARCAPGRGGCGATGRDGGRRVPPDPDPRGTRDGRAGPPSAERRPAERRRDQPCAFSYASRMPAGTRPRSLTS